MMTMLLILGIMLIASTSLGSKNPLKLSILLTIYSMMMFYFVSLKTGEKWFPILYFLLFMGGILMMFMILSSVLPNEKSGKMKKIHLSIMILLTMIAVGDSSNFENLAQTSLDLKSSLTSGLLMPYLMAMMLMYFFCAIYMISSKKSPMRNITCQSKSLFCK